MTRSESGSTALVASSSRRIAGSARKARATERRWRWPPESLTAALAHQSRVAVGQGEDEVVGVGGAGGGFDVLLGSLRAGVADVLGNAGPEQERLLLDGGDLAAQGALGDIAQVVAVNQNTA